MSRTACTKLVVAAAIALAGLTACNRHEPLYPVEAQVFVDGQPAAGALVVLHPVENTSPAAIRPAGYVDDDGRLKFTSYLAAARASAEGAPAGEYIVTISWLPADVKDYLARHPTTVLPDKLEGRYSQPDRSSLRAKVLPQPTQLGRIELRTGPPTSTSLKQPADSRGSGRQNRTVSSGGSSHG